MIDDDFVLYSLIRDYLRNSEFLPEHAADAESGLFRLLTHDITWHIVLLDVMLPGINGMEALRRIRTSPATADLPILMLTAQDGECEKVEGLEAGADDYLVKPFSFLELSARLRAILRRSARHVTDNDMQKDTLRLDDLIIDSTALSVDVGGTSVRLTPAEMRVLEALVAEPGKTVPRTNLSQMISGHIAYPRERGLDMTISRLRKKLGRRADGGERIQATWGEGYMFLLGREPP